MSVTYYVCLRQPVPEPRGGWNSLGALSVLERSPGRVDLSDFPPEAKDSVSVLEVSYTASRVEYYVALLLLEKIAAMGRGQVYFYDGDYDLVYAHSGPATSEPDLRAWWTAELEACAAKRRADAEAARRRYEEAAAKDPKAYQEADDWSDV
ncbi:MAG: hypothetical protein R3A79_26595 [Nannocystaceae bacterium]